MRSRFRRIGEGGALGVAGWLFAELALVLVVISFGSESGPSPRAEPHPTVPAPVPPSPAATPGAEQEGLLLDSVVFYVTVSSSGAGVLADFRREMDAKVRPDQRVGLVQLFGRARGGVSGPEVSRQLMRIVAGQVPKLPREQQIRPFLGDEGAPGTVKVEMFLMTGTP